MDVENILNENNDVEFYEFLIMGGYIYWNNSYNLVF